MYPESFQLEKIYVVLSVPHLDDKRVALITCGSVAFIIYTLTKNFKIGLFAYKILNHGQPAYLTELGILVSKYF